jgi:hypothetical protein
MEKNVFSDDQERQILNALKELDTDIGIDRLDDDKDLARVFSKFSDYELAKSKLAEQKTSIEVTRRTLGVYLGSAFTGGLAVAGALVAMVPTLIAPSLIATRSVSVDTVQSTALISPSYQLPENLDTQYTVNISTEDPYELLIKLTEAGTRAGLTAFVLGGSSNRLRMNLYGLEQGNPQHLLLWDLLGIAPSEYRSLSVVITK